MFEGFFLSRVESLVELARVVLDLYLWKPASMIPLFWTQEFGSIPSTFPNHGLNKDLKQFENHRR